jgi:hypothetical protein
MTMPSNKLRIFVSGAIASTPYQGGATWAVLQYILGFRKLGHEVYFIEPIKESDLRPIGTNLSQSVNVAYFEQKVSKTFNLKENSALLLSETHETIGISYDRLKLIAKDTDVHINISGMLKDEELTVNIPHRVYLDLDPAFNQLWYTAENIDVSYGTHTHFVTIGLLIGQNGCNIPTCGKSWITTLQPIVLDFWPKVEEITYNGLTTIGNWRSYGSIEYKNIFYGQKAHSLRQFIKLPSLTKEPCILAYAIHPAEEKDLNLLNTNGWHMLNPSSLVSDPISYMKFIQGSKAELGITKSGYVAAHCGWFSDRSICYLASGRPVIAQETGFSNFIPKGEGLWAFETIDDILSSIELINTNYKSQAHAARSIAEIYFDSNKVLSNLLYKIGTNA